VSNKENNEGHISPQYLATELANIRSLMMKVIESNQQVISEVGLIKLKFDHSEEKTKRLLQLSDGYGSDIEELSRTLTVHSTIWKIIGTIGVASFGLIGWGYSTLQGINGNLNNSDKRISFIEYTISREPSVKIPVPTQPLK
jgi:hypothetical protein